MVARPAVAGHVLGMAKRMARKHGQRLERIRTLLAEGNAEAAWAEARGLLASRRGDANVLSLAGAAAYQAGEVATAADLLADAAAKAPGNPEIQMNYGNVLAGLGRLDDALAAYRLAHDRAPKFAEPAYNAGLLMTAAGRHAEAADWFAQALDRDPDHAQATIAQAEALREAGNLGLSRDVLEALVARQPDDAVALTNLAASFSALGDDAAARDVALRAVAADPGLAAAHFNLGVAEQALGQPSEAVERYRRVLALQPENAAAALNQGEAYLTLDDADAARTAFRRALSIDPDFSKAAISLADMDLVAGAADAALATVDTFLERRPAQPAALAMRAIVLRELGDDDAAQVLDDVDRFIVPRQIAPPAGYADIAAFNAALAAHILDHPSLTPAPAAHATRKGRHTGELLTPPLGPMAEFEALVRAAFTDYRRAFLGQAAHPFLDAAPRDIDVTVWAVVMDAEGHQVPHIHPSAWLSGVYYVEIPNSIRAENPDHAGWIEFGRPPDDIHADRIGPLRMIQPEEGKMVLFPSHFYHRTIPLAGEKRRISMAFDVMAKSPSKPGQM